jgi:hypothetical protein
MNKMRWSDLMVMPNMLAMGLGIMLVIKPYPIDAVSVGVIMTILGLTNAVVIYFRK